MDSLKQLRVMYLAQGYFDSSSSFILFNLVGCGGGISRFKSRWEEFCWKISTTHARTYHNQRISLRLKNRLFLSLFPRANLTYVWCRFGAYNGLDYNEVGLFEVSPWLLVQMNSIWYLQHLLWISPPAPNAQSPPPGLHLWLNCLTRKIFSTFTLILSSIIQYKHWSTSLMRCIYYPS